MELFQKIQLLAQLIRCGDEVYAWCYRADGTLLHSNCPEEAFLDEAFERFGCKQQMLDYAQDHSKPVTLGTAMGIEWAAAFEMQDGVLQHCWVIGPVFYRETSLQSVERGVKYYKEKNLSVAWTMQLYKVLKTLPVLQHTVFHRYLLMLHYCVTEEQLELSELNSEAVLAKTDERMPEMQRDRHKVWMAEQALLQMVRTGDLNYSQALSNSFGISAGVPVESDDALRQSKTSLIVFSSIVCRAAIEGGLSPEEAYALGDRYIQTVESAKTLSELDPLATIMYDDFVHRVHRCRTNPNLSRQIQQCVDYIEMHLEQKISAAEMAELIGYTEYYLTRKFKEETGLSLTNYTRFAKIERAKVLLKSSDRTVQEIAVQLGFGTRNYFSHVFRQVTGQTPVQYRENG